MISCDVGFFDGRDRFAIRFVLEPGGCPARRVPIGVARRRIRRPPQLASTLPMTIRLVTMIVKRYRFCLLSSFFSWDLCDRGMNSSATLHRLAPRGGVE